jgi:hypothetical protein
MRETTVKCSLKGDDAKVWYDFKQAVIQKHGKLRGSLGDEVANALRTYLVLEDRKIGPQQHTRTDRKEKVERYHGIYEDQKLLRTNGKGHPWDH